MNNKHIAFIPARQGSVGLKHKNRLFFDNTANFLDKVDIFDEVLVSSDDCEGQESLRHGEFSIFVYSSCWNLGIF